MQTNLEEAESDLSAEWMTLSSKVHTLVSRLNEKAHGTHLEADTLELLGETTLLCDHLMRLHREVGNLLTEPDDKLSESTTVDLDDIQREAIQIHREAHELRADFKDIIKALFMWQDDPAERVLKKN
jgi:hypothetical protein